MSASSVNLPKTARRRYQWISGVASTIRISAWFGPETSAATLGMEVDQDARITETAMIIGNDEFDFNDPCQ
jgi:hypothetical protein